MTWFWSLLWGLLYFWAHGFAVNGFIALFLAFTIVGYIGVPFLAYYSWKQHAGKKATRTIAVNKLIGA